MAGLCGTALSEERREPKRRREAAAASPPAPGAEAREEGQVQHVLAFGDSLTWGGCGSRPYPEQLEALLNGQCGGHTRYKVHNAGICGESTEEMVSRLPDELASLEQDGVRPSFVLLLGGTNDLGHLAPKEILANLAKMRAVAMRAQASCVALTIPRTEDGLSPVARVVNRGLRREAAREGGPILADVSVVPEERLSDGVHFNSEGYAEFARLVFEAMQPSL
uniref:SGNH hydrolase-type esterase domain-containing protein n=1 Tax=Pyrodinium bahamense TaxID=73915 RepID=A0A7R9ZUI0_9DINO